MSDTNELVGLADETGSELVDLRTELAMTDGEARSWLDVPAHEITPDLARLTGFADDYRWMTGLADVLERAGCHVVQYPGWKVRGRPRSVGPFTPRGVMWHHDASAPGPSPSLARFIAEEGRPAEGIPAPLAQLWVCQGCDGAHPHGTWHVLAAGRANHAGEGGGWGAIPANYGASLTLGVETDNTTNEDTRAAMYDALVIGTAAILERLGGHPRQWLAGHKEYAAGRKIDPDDIDMDEAREHVAIAFRQPWPGTKHFELGHDCQHGYVERLERWLLELPANRKSTHKPSTTFTRWTADRVKAFEKGHKRLAERANGKPGALSWHLIHRAAAGARS